MRLFGRPKACYVTVKRSAIAVSNQHDAFTIVGRLVSGPPLNSIRKVGLSGRRSGLGNQRSGMIGGRRNQHMPSREWQIRSGGNRLVDSARMVVAARLVLNRTTNDFTEASVRRSMSRASGLKM